MIKKQLILGVMLFLLALPLISAYDFDNVKNYDPLTKTATIINAWDLPYFGEQIVNVTLLTPASVWVDIKKCDKGYDPKLKKGLECMVAMFKLEGLKGEYDNPFSEIKSYNYNNLDQERNKIYTFKKAVVKGTHLEDIYSWTCDTGKVNATGQADIICYDKLTGSKEVKDYEYVIIDPSKISEDGIYALYTDVSNEERTEWIPSWFGVKIAEWGDFGSAELKYSWTQAGADNNYGGYSRMLALYFNVSTSFNLVGISANLLLDTAGWSAGDCNWTLYGVYDNNNTLNPSLYYGMINNTFLSTSITDNIYSNFTSYPLVVNSDRTNVLTTQCKDSSKRFAWNGKQTGSNYQTVSGNSSNHFDLIRTDPIGDGTGISHYPAGDVRFMLWGTTLVTSVAPNLSIVTPTSANVSAGNTGITYNVETANYCWYSTDNFVINTSITCGQNITGLTSNEGYNYWGIGANESTGKNNMSSVIFMLDTIIPNITITAPLNQSYGNNVSYGNFSFGQDNLTDYIYSLDNFATNYTLPVGTNITNLTTAEGSNTLYAWVNDNVGNANWTYVTFFYDSLYPKITNGSRTLNDWTNISSNWIYLDIIYTEANLENITYTLRGSTGAIVDQTIFNTGVSSLNWTSISEGVYNYSATICDKTSKCNSTRTLTINLDSSPPIQNITTPREGQLFVNVSSNYNISLAWTITDNSLANCWLYNASGIENTTVTCGFNSSMLLSGGDYSLFVYANDSVGNEVASNVNISVVTITEEYANFTDPLIEGVTYIFSLNISASDIINFNASLNYNGTVYNTTLISNNNTLGSLITSITATNVSETISRYFYWTYGIYGSYFNTSLYDLSIYSITPINISYSCASGLSPAMCWNMKDETNFTDLYGNIAYNFKFGVSNATYKTVYGSLNNTNNFCLCINSTIYNNYSLGEGEIQYSKTGWADRRFYTFSTQRLSNETINNTLYLLSGGTSFLFDFKDNVLNPFISNYSALLRWYPELDQYIVVEMAKTDDKGETIMRVEVEDVDYRVGLYNQDGTLIKLVNPVRFACLSSPCSYSVPISETESDYTSFFSVNGGITFNETTNIWVLTWSDTTQATDEMRLVVTRERGDGYVTVCDTSATGFTGVLTCDSTGYTGTLKAVAYRTASPAVVLFQKIINTITTPFKGTLGLFLSFVIFLVLILIGIFSPIVSIVLGVVALFPAYLLGSINLTIMIGIAVLGGIVIHFAQRTR